MKNFIEKVYKTLAFYQGEIIGALRGLHFDMLSVEMHDPVFVVGCSRAGTTLVYKTLSESRGLGSLHRETHDFWAQLHPPAARQWISHEIPPDLANDQDRRLVDKLFYTATGKTRFVDKNNQNGLSIPYLRGLYPDAFFIYVKRHPGDNIHSLIEGWRRADTFATWSDQLPAEVAIENGRFRRWCFFLAEGWRDYLTASIEEVCAFQYREMNQAILAARQAVDPERWCEVRYESILDDPVETFRGIFTHCRIPFDAHLERHCSQVLENPYNAFSKIGKEKWKSTENRDRIEKILPQVWPVAQAMGYRE